MSLDELLSTNNTNSVAYISVEELNEIQLNEEILILDSREASEYNVSHIASAKYVGFNQFSKKEFKKQYSDKNTPIIVYCSLGIRSERIGEKLQKMGYTNVKNLYGGIFEWKNKGNTVIDSTNVITENIHVFSKLWSKWLTTGVKVYGR